MCAVTLKLVQILSVVTTIPEKIELQNKGLKEGNDVS